MQFLSHKKIEKETTVIIRGLFNFIWNITYKKYYYLLDNLILTPK